MRRGIWQDGASQATASSPLQLLQEPDDPRMAARPAPRMNAMQSRRLCSDVSRWPVSHVVARSACADARPIDPPQGRALCPTFYAPLRPGPHPVATDGVACRLDGGRNAVFSVWTGSQSCDSSALGGGLTWVDLRATAFSFTEPSRRSCCMSCNTFQSNRVLAHRALPADRNEGEAMK